ncbi:unnamed protein product [Polarella glacialis]|uniref:Fe2OG dioxygenase domain-containing protein n=1 Tax=Polarella glacialis TaxID=89957 RepID=A0A813IJA0_POLGL|nr:unnamed protein product [Polarella glacialis]CAE8650605.1 unnamed protein product [Polarella glacialis]CAE8677989.1 unnamed protein product [Polarella glacialis]
MNPSASLESAFAAAFERSAADATAVPVREDVLGVPGAFVLLDALTESETEALRRFVRLAHEQRAAAALASMPSSASEKDEEKRRDSQHHVPVHVPSVALGTLAQRIRPVLPTAAGPKNLAELEAQGKEISTFLRCYLYSPGDSSKPHFDRPWSEHTPDGALAVFSAYSVLVYLSDSFEGGHTTFFQQDDAVRISCSGLTPICDRDALVAVAQVAPRSGDILFFPHGSRSGCFPNPLHEGSTVVGGEKLLIRTDLLFRMPQKRTMGLQPQFHPYLNPAPVAVDSEELGLQEQEVSCGGRTAAQQIQRLREEASQARLAKRAARSARQPRRAPGDGTEKPDETDIHNTMPQKTAVTQDFSDSCVDNVLPL